MKLKKYFSPVFNAVAYASEQGRKDFDGGLQAMRALSYMDKLSMLDFIPLPRSITIVMALFWVQHLHNEFRREEVDEDGFGGGTFHDVQRALWSFLFSSLLFESIVILVLTLYLFNT